MKAMVFAAGLGTRLGGLTRDTPKCLMEAGGKTLLMLTLEKLAASGVDTVVINLFYLAEKIEEYLERHGTAGLTVHLSREDELLGTGGGLWNARRHFEGEECFFVHNSDVYSEIDLRALAESHRAGAACVSLAVMRRRTSRVLLFDEGGRLVGWENGAEGRCEVFGGSGDPEALAFSGVQCVSPSIFRYGEDKRPPFSTIGAFMDAAKAGERVLAHRVDGAYWIDIGTPAHLAELRHLLSDSSGMD